MNTSSDLPLSGVSPSLESLTPPGGGESSTKSSAPFLDVLSRMLDDVNQLQQDADSSIQQLVAGKEGVELHDVMLQLEEAGVAFELMMEIRNKLVDAYQQLLRMQP